MRRFVGLALLLLLTGCARDSVGHRGVLLGTPRAEVERRVPGLQDAPEDLARFSTKAGVARFVHDSLHGEVVVYGFTDEVLTSTTVLYEQDDPGRLERLELRYGAPTEEAWIGGGGLAMWKGHQNVGYAKSPKPKTFELPAAEDEEPERFATQAFLSYAYPKGGPGSSFPLWPVVLGLSCLALAVVGGMVFDLRKHERSPRLRERLALHKRAEPAIAVGVLAAGAVACASVVLDAMSLETAIAILVGPLIGLKALHMHYEKTRDAALERLDSDEPAR